MSLGRFAFTAYPTPRIATAAILAFKAVGCLLLKEDAATQDPFNVLQVKPAKDVATLKTFCATVVVADASFELVEVTKSVKLERYELFNELVSGTDIFSS